MLKKVIAASLGLALSACGDGGSQQQPPTRVEIANPVSDQLKGGDDLYKSIGLRRAIVDSSLPCKKVDAGSFQQSYKNLALWTVHCTDSGRWAVFIAATGDAQVRRCDHMAQLGLPECAAPAPLSVPDRSRKPAR